MNEFLGRRIVRQPTNPWVQMGVGLGCALIATAARLALAPLIPQSTPFILFFPAVMVASVLAGARGGGACLAACVIATPFVFKGAMGAGGVYGRLLAALIFVASAGAIVWLTSMLRQALIEASAAREQERMMLSELQHRVKNTLTVVQALAAQTLSAGLDPPAAKRAFTERLIALAQAHNLLSDAAWTDVSMGEVAQRALAPFIDDGGGRIGLEGAAVPLAPDHVVSIALCLHELATNATKYGALSTPQGRVAVSWRRVEGRRLRLDWREEDGPPVTPPTRRGFGSRLLKQGVSSRAHPVVVIEHPPEGMRWSVTFDVGVPI